jgi:hypothetical protein
VWLTLLLAVSLPLLFDIAFVIVIKVGYALSSLGQCSFRRGSR